MNKQAKKILAVLLSAITVIANFTLGLTALTANADELTSGIFTYEIVDGEVTITDCDYNVTGELAVPSHIGGYPVTTIDEYAFSSCSDITKFVLPDTVVVAEDNGLPAGYNLTEIDFGSSITKIVGFHWFSSNYEMEVTLPDSLILVDDVFIRCGNIYLGKNFRYYDGENTTFNATCINVSSDNPYFKSVDGVLLSKDGKTLVQYPTNNKATSYTVPSSVEIIGKDAFMGAKSLEQVIIHDNVKTIESRAFHGCEKLNDIKIGSGIETIGQNAFHSCGIYNNASNWIGGILYVDNCAITYNESLPKSATIKNGTRLIAEFAFHDAPFEYVNIPETVKYIGEYAFCESELKSVVVPDSVTSLPYRAFGVCSNLESIVVGDGVKALHDSSINSNNLTSIKFGNSLEYISETAMYTTAFYKDKNNYNGNELIVDNYLIDAEYTTNGTYHIGKDIKCIAEGAFRSCSQITGFTVDKNNPNYSTDEYGVLFNKDKTVLVAYPSKLALAEYTVPSTVKKIGEYAFSNSYSTLTKLNLPEGIVEIGENAFFSNYTIEEVNFPSTLRIIGKSAFNYARKLESVDFSEGITFIDDYAFDDCRALKYVSIPDSVTEMGRSVFRRCSGLENVVVGSGLRELPMETFDSCNSLKTVTFNNTIDVVGDSSFPNEMPLTDIYYTGTKEQWRAINFDWFRNDSINSATIHYNSEIPDEPQVHKHSYSSSVTTEPTCEDYGVRTYTCSCGNSYTETIPKADHSLGEWVVIKNPTVADYGIKVQYCSVCLKPFNETNIDKLPASSYSDGSTGVIISYPSDIGDFAPIITMLTNGVEQNSEGRYVKYEVSFETSGVIQVKIPVPEDFKVNQLVGGFLAADGSYTGFSSVKYENGYMVFTVDRAGTFTILEVKVRYRAEIRTPSTVKISYGDSMILHLDSNIALPAGYRIEWFADNGNFDYNVSSDGTTCTITPKKSGNTTFTVIVYDENGNVVLEDEQTMNSKAGFFDKFVAFFKKLFGLSKIFQQSVDMMF